MFVVLFVYRSTVLLRRLLLVRHTLLPGNILTFLIGMTPMSTRIRIEVRLPTTRVEVDQQVGAGVAVGDGDLVRLHRFNVLMSDGLRLRIDVSVSSHDDCGVKGGG